MTLAPAGDYQLYNSKYDKLIKPTEHKIITGCQAQNPLYQKELVLRYSGLLLSVARRYTVDHSLAKDIIQESLIKILKAIPDYQPTGSFEHWMKRIVINTALQKRKLKRFSFELNGFENLPEKEIDPSIYSTLGAEELIHLIQQLPEGYREIFNLHAIEGYSHAEIGALLNITESTSRSQLSRARTLLQKQLQTREKISIRL